MGFIQSVSDPCIYTEAEDMLFIGVYVDEIILAGCSDKKIREDKGALAFKFDIKDMGNYGIKILQDEKSGLVNHPIPIIFKIVKQSVYQLLVPNLSRQPVEMNVLISSFINLPLEVCCTYQSARSDTSLAKFSSNPTKQHWTALKRVMHYLKGTVYCVIINYSKKGSPKCICFSDANWLEILTIEDQPD